VTRTQPQPVPRRLRQPSWRRGRRRRRRGRHGGGGRGRRSAAFERARFDLGRRHRSRNGQRRIGAWRDDAQDLPDFEQVGVVDVVPTRNVAPVLSALEADADQRVAGLTL